MVFPELVTIPDGKGGTRSLPRARKYLENNLEYYEVYLMAFSGQKLNQLSVSKMLYERFNEVDKIYFISKTKLKLILRSADAANKIACDEMLINEFNLSIPYSRVEVRGRVPLPLDLNEKQIFENLNIFGLNKYHPTSILEVKRLTKFDAVSKSRSPIETVMITFSGTTLPRNVEFEKLILPVYEHREPILQCQKCWSYGHSSRSCRSHFPRCINCGVRENKHGESCDSLVCVNCLGNHRADFENCPALLKIKIHKKSISEGLFVPTPVIMNMDNFPALPSSNRLKKTAISNEMSISISNDNKRKRLADDEISCENLTDSISEPAPENLPVVTEVDIPNLISNFIVRISEDLTSNTTWLENLVKIAHNANDNSIDLDNQLNTPLQFKQIINNELENITANFMQSAFKRSN